MFISKYVRNILPLASSITFHNHHEGLHSYFRYNRLNLGLNVTINLTNQVNDGFATNTCHFRLYLHHYLTSASYFVFNEVSRLQYFYR